MPRLARLSKGLFGRAAALEIYAAVAAHPKDVFSSAEVRAFCGGELPDSVVSKQLGDLARLGLLRRVNYRGVFERQDDPFWRLVSELVAAWESAPPEAPG